MIDYLGMPDKWRHMITGSSVNSPWSGAGHQGDHAHTTQGGVAQVIPKVVVDQPTCRVAV